METTERIVESYCRYVRQWATIPNIRCAGGFEIDLLAIDMRTGLRYHVETSVSISSGFARLNGKAFDEAALKTRAGGPSQRRTVGFFVRRKFGPASVMAALGEHGFQPGNYQRVIVTWGWDDEAEEKANAESIELWDFRRILVEIVEHYRHDSSYLSDDTLRTLQLYAQAQEQLAKAERHEETKGMPTAGRGSTVVPNVDGPFVSYLRTTGRGDRTIYHYQQRIQSFKAASIDLGNPAQVESFLAKQPASTHGQYKSARNAYLEWQAHVERQTAVST